jgi:hypothetical protein
MCVIMHRLEIDERLGVVLLDGARVHGVRFRSKLWQLLLAFVRAGEDGLRGEQLYCICLTGKRGDPNDAVRDVIRKLRRKLEACGGSEDTIQRVGTGQWRLLAEATIVAPGSLGVRATKATLNHEKPRATAGRHEQPRALARLPSTQVPRSSRRIRQRFIS